MPEARNMINSLPNNGAFRYLTDDHNGRQSVEKGKMQYIELRVLY